MKTRAAAGILWLLAFLAGSNALGQQEALYTEIEPLDIPFKRLSTLRLHPDGNLLAVDAATSEIKVIGPDGKVVRTILPGFGPEALDVRPDGTIYCGGEGKIARIDTTGAVVTVVDAPVPSDDVQVDRRRGRGSRRRVSGIAVSDQDVFIALGEGGSTGSRSDLYRFDLDLKTPQRIMEGLRGCCQRCDMVFKDGVLYIAENSVHRVVKVDRNGEVIAKWGNRDRSSIDGFGSCCNPMNLCFGSDGLLYTAESGLGRIKRYTTAGEFRDLIGYVGVERFNTAGGLAASCSNIAIDVTRDGRRLYVMDYKNCIVRVLEKKE